MTLQPPPSSGDARQLKLAVSSACVLASLGLDWLLPATLPYVARKALVTIPVLAAAHAMATYLLWQSTSASLKTWGPWLAVAACLGLLIGVELWLRVR